MIMPSAEIIAIGTELLLGEIQDSNTRYLAKKLRNINVDLYRSTVIGDNISRISDLINEALSRADIIITSGGLGPTVDDPTREAVADAVKEDLVFQPQLWEQIEDRFRRYGRTPTENNRRQAYIPRNAIPVENPVGTAPAFIVQMGNKCIISLPGVPRELEYLLENEVIPYLTTQYELSGVIKVCVLHSSGLGESMVDEKVADLERLSNPTVGLLAHPGQTDIRITAKAKSEDQAQQMINELRNTIMSRLGEHIYGMDDDTLEGILDRLLREQKLNLDIYETGFSEYFSEKINKTVLSDTNLFSLPYTTQQIFAESFTTLPIPKDHILLGIYFNMGSGWPAVHTMIRTIHSNSEMDRSYGGPLQNAPQWAYSTAIDYLRRFIGTTRQGE
jgi:competence/damage-inducible protein CinA-like protein